MTRQALKNIHKLIQAHQEQIPLNEQFLADLKRGIEKLDEKDARPSSNYYKPSSLTCIRNMFYQRIKEPAQTSTFDYCLIGIVQSGSSRHDVLQGTISRLKELNIDCEYIDVEKYIKEKALNYLEIRDKSGHETKLFHKDLQLSFMCDGIIKYKGKYFILEIKTESMYKFQSRKDIAKEHIIQGTAYATCFGINEVMFLYENRDICDKKAYILEVTEQMKKELIIDRIVACEEHVNRLQVPTKPKEANAKFCQYCNYKSACKRDS